MQNKHVVWPQLTRVISLVSLFVVGLHQERSEQESQRCLTWFTLWSKVRQDVRRKQIILINTRELYGQIVCSQSQIRPCMVQSSASSLLSLGIPLLVTHLPKLYTV